MSNNAPEFYLIILWEKCNINPEIVKEKVKEFNMTVELTEGELEKKSQLQFIEQLYYKSITDFNEKIKRVGCNKFQIGIIKDENPNYSITPTTRGFQLINKNVFQLKKELRELSSVSDGVHISDTREESEHNIFLAFSIIYERINLKNLKFKPNKISTLEDAFSFLNISTKYVVQRNFDEVFDRDKANHGHGNIDILVEDTESVARLIGAIHATEDPLRKLYKLQFYENEILIYIRDVRDNYYDSIWSKEILHSRTFNDVYNFYIPNHSNHIYMLMYHSLIHKFDLNSDSSKEYLDQLIDLTKSIKGGEIHNWNEAIISLRRFMLKNQYFISTPIDKTVKVNPFTAITIGAIENKYLTRTELLPEHHARNFVKDIFSNPIKLHEKEGSIHRSIVLTGAKEPFNSIVVKMTQSKDLTFSPYIYSEHKYIQLLGTEFAPRLIANFITEGWYTIIMERIKGVALNELIKQKKLSTEILNILERKFEDLLVVLKSKNIAHRDLRASNIFITDNLGIKIIDFGLSASTFDLEAPLPKNIQGSGNDADDIDKIIKEISSTLN